MAIVVAQLALASPASSQEGSVAPPAPDGFETSDIVRTPPESGLSPSSIEPEAVPSTASKFQALSPTRVLDTRPGSRKGYTGEKPAAGAIVRLTVRGVAGVAANASAVVGNLTVTEANRAGFVTAYPSGGAVPPVSNVNTEFAGQTIPNSVTVPIGSDDSISLYDQAGSHLVFDIVGFYVPVGGATRAGRTVTLSPARVFDSRPGTRVNSNGLIVPSTGTTKVVVARRAGVPAAAQGVILNVTATESSAAGWVQLGPFGGYVRGASSSLNLGYAGQTIANQVIVPLGTDGAIGIDVQSPVHIVIDVTGYITDATAPSTDSGLFVPLTPARLIDTRDRGVKPWGDRRIGVITGGYGGVPQSAYGAVAINATLVDATSPGYIQFAPAGTLVRGASSTVNADRTGQTIANAATLSATNQGLDAYTQNGAHLIVDVAGYFTGGPQPPFSDPLGLLVDGALGRAVGNGTDLFAVWLCVIPPDTTDPTYQYYAQRGLLLPITPGDAAATAAEGTAAYFTAISNHRYFPVFWTAGSIQLARNEGPPQCLQRAREATRLPFTNVYAVDNSGYGGGFGGPGGIMTNSGVLSGSTLFSAPSSTDRGFWGGGGSVAPVRTPALQAHEIGHTLHWPHSFTGVSGSQYDNPMDLMSMSPQFGGWCPKSPYSMTSNCYIQHTLAINRYLSGWIDPTDVVVHTSGTRTVDLAGPLASGTQFVAAKSSDPLVIATIEARPRTNWDSILDKGGVTVHISDQRLGACEKWYSWMTNCRSTDRRVSQAQGAPYSYDHVIGPGESMWTHGLLIENLGATWTGYKTRVTGTFVP
ncbi:MAG: hypothetical protein FGM58_03170 [Acidimicrobiia bacterium]|nr:hypothetical protein [Acidimicrobiia bacterium]